MQTGKCPMTRINMSLKDIRKFDLKDISKKKSKEYTLNNQSQIIEMLNALMKLGISEAHVIEEADGGWQIIKKK